MSQEKFNHGVYLPNWLVGILITLALTFLAFTVKASVQAGKMQNQIEQYEKSLDRIYEQLNRIELKIDSHIISTPKR